MTRMIVWVIALAMAVCTGVSLAGEEAKTPTPEEMQAQMKAYMEASLPGPHHELYKTMAGKYDATMTMWTAPGTEPTVSKGKSSYELMLGDRFLMHKHESNFMGMPFAGWGVSGFDQTKNKHTVYWVDNMGTQALYAEGECTDKCMKETYTFSMTDPVLKTENKVKMVTTMKSKDEHVMEWFMLNPDGSSFKSMEIVYKRASS